MEVCGVGGAMNAPSPSIIESIDSHVDVPVEKDEAVEKAVKQCIKASNDADASYRYYSGDDMYTLFFKPLDVPVLSPDKINLSLQHLLRVPHMLSVDVSTYISVLMQKSYDLGNNGFVLHTQNIPLDSLCAYVKGSKKMPLSMAVYGDTGHFMGHASEWCSVKHEGNAQDHYFDDAEHAEISSSGTVGECPFQFVQDIMFKTTNQETFNHIKTKMQSYPKMRGRNLSLVDPAGKTLDSWDDSAYKRALR